MCQLAYCGEGAPAVAAFVARMADLDATAALAGAWAEAVDDARHFGYWNRQA